MKNKRRHVQFAPRESKKSKLNDDRSDISDDGQAAISSESESDENFFDRDRKVHFDDESDVEEVLPITNDDESIDEEDSDLNEEHDENDTLENESSFNAEADESLDDDDDDESSSNDDESINNLSAWGNKKGMFFNADFVDQDRGKSYREEDMETAKAEEKDALRIQKLFMSNIRPSALATVSFPAQKSTDNDNLEVSAPDWKHISKTEKLQVIQKKNPEFIPIMHTFKDKLKELQTRMLPLMQHLKKMSVGAEPYANYICLKTQILLHYCMNASFYMTLKSLNIPLTRHPVVKKINGFKKLLDRFECLDEKLNPQLDKMLENLKQSETICEGLSKMFSSKEKIFPTELENGSEDGDVRKEPRKSKIKKSVHFETETEKEVLAGYTDMKDQQRKELNTDSKQLLSNEDSEDEDIENAEEDGLNAKRSISYQIAKNKGLIPRRKKEYRNPRVRHRMKFKKAQIRRKGQVRLPRKEIKKYAGELSGISANVTKSIKIK